MVRRDGSRKTAAALVAAVGLTALLASSTLLAAPAQAGPSSCARVDDIRLSWYTIAPGSTVGVTSTVTNCTNQKERYTVVQSHTSACGVVTTICQGRLAFRPGETKMVTCSYQTASSTCLGQGPVTVQVHGSGLLASDSTTLTVQ